MDIHGFGIDYTTRNRLVQSLDEEELSKKIMASFPHETLDYSTRLVMYGHTFAREIPRAHLGEESDPKVVGWKFLVGKSDPQKDKIIEAITPLAIHRGMTDPTDPLIYDCENEWEWWDWIRKNCWSRAVDEHPLYVLIIGDPKQVPFRFQSFLDCTSAVGRIDFDTIEQIKTYVKKIIDLEEAEEPIVNRETLMFAPNWGINDPTYYSKTFMAEPLSEHIKNKIDFQTKDLLDDDATKKKLVESLMDKSPALVYTASHGLGAPKENLETQKKYNGSICCQNMQDTSVSLKDCIFSADDVRTNKPFLEGSVFFEFSCFGYGTPKHSDYEHWIGNPSLNSSEDFISALPKKLTAHPQGPIGFFGHVDTAWLHGFADPENPYILQRWSSRIAPFRKAVEEILRAQTLGLVLKVMNENYGIGNAIISMTYDRIKSGHEVLTPESTKRLIEAWITRSDAQNYMLFGDPGTYVRIPAP